MTDAGWTSSRSAGATCCRRSWIGAGEVFLGAVLMFLAICFQTAWEPTAMMMSQIAAPTNRLRLHCLTRSSEFIATTSRKQGSTNRRVRGVSRRIEMGTCRLRLAGNKASRATIWIHVRKSGCLRRVNAARRAAAIQKINPASRPGDRFCAVAVQYGAEFRRDIGADESNVEGGKNADRDQHRAYKRGEIRRAVQTAMATPGIRNTVDQAMGSVRTNAAVRTQNRRLVGCWR